jgi:hypothetical protein
MRNILGRWYEKGLKGLMAWGGVGLSYAGGKITFIISGLHLLELLRIRFHGLKCEKI